MAVPPVEVSALTAGRQGEASEAVRARVIRARDVQRRRSEALGLTARVNAALSDSELERVAPLGRDTRRLMELAVDKLGLSARAFAKVLRVARTIADLEGEEGVRQPHVAERGGRRQGERRQKPAAADRAVASRSKRRAPVERASAKSRSRPSRAASRSLSILALGGSGSPDEQPLCTLGRYVSQPASELPDNVVFLVLSDEDHVAPTSDCLTSFDSELKETMQVVEYTTCSSDCDFYYYRRHLRGGSRLHLCCVHGYGRNDPPHREVDVGQRGQPAEL